MTASDEKTGQQQAWKSLSEARLVEIRLEEFSERIKDVKHVVMGRLSELLELKSGMKERESAAYSLATLKKLETTVEANAPKPGRPDLKE